MKEILTESGFYKYYSCSCGGSYKEKYKHPGKPGVEIHIRPNRNVWFHLLNKKQVGTGNISTLKTKLETL